MVRLSLLMHINGLCYTDEEAEEKIKNSWLPKWLFGCSKESSCSVFKLCALINSGMEAMILCVAVLAVIAGAFWVLQSCLTELNMACCTLCGYYDPDNGNETDNDKENRNGKKRRMKDTQCRGCIKRRKGARGCCYGTRIHAMDHVCVDPQHMHSNPIRLLVRAEEVHIRPVQDPENLIPTEYEAQPGEEERRRSRERRSRSRSPVAARPRVPRGTPNSYTVEDSPPRSPRVYDVEDSPPRPARDEGGCKPTTAFSLRAALDSSSEEEMESEGKGAARP